MIEYKTFDVTYWFDTNEDAAFDKVFETFDVSGNHGFAKSSINEMRESMASCEQSAKKARKNKQFYLDAAEGYGLTIEKVLRDCPKIDPDEQFLLLFEW